METIKIYIVVVENMVTENKYIDRPFPTLEEAKSRIERLEEKGYSAYIEERYMNI